MAHLVGLLVVVGLAATAFAFDPFTHNGRNLQQSCPSFSAATLEPTKTRFPVFDLEWVGADDQTVYALTSDLSSAKGGIWRSKDGGAHFEDLTSKLNGNASQAVAIIGIHAQKSNANNILILGAGTSMWISNDKGESMTRLDYPGGVKGVFFRDIRFNPRRDNWLLVHVKRAACKVMDKAHLECPKDLMLNKDVFNPSSPWVNLTTNSNGAIAGFVDFDWGANLCPSNNCTGLKPIPDEQILATTFARTEDYDQPWDKDVSFVSSPDWFATVNTRVPCGNQLEVVGRSVYLAVANGCPNSPDGSPLPATTRTSTDSITLFTSMDGGNEFARACLPAALKQDGYELVETHDGRGALVIVDFSVDTGMMMPVYAASVYAAGPHHALFSLSLTNVFQGMGGTTTDFTRLEGLPGIYITNQVVPYPLSDGSAGSTDPGSMPMPGMGDAGYMDYYDAYYDLADLVGAPLIETRITYSAGGRWQRIRAPASVTNAACACGDKPPCYLHLNGMSPTTGTGVALPGVYSNPSAPGLVLATGNLAPLGAGLDQKSPATCTWLSRDGGVTWQDVAVGPYIYEFADWGGVIVMAKYPGVDRYAPAGLTKEVLFSVDYGRCWQSVPLKVPLYVDNIRIEPDGQRPVVILHGEAPRDAAAGLNGTEGLIYTLNVKDITGYPVCNPTSPAEFETWSPPTINGTGARCVLGQKLALTRRKQDSKCFYGPTYKRPEPSVVANCTCTKQLDTECDYGFVRSNDSCVALPSTSMPQCPVVEQGIYTVSSAGLRKVQGDKCEDSSAIIPDTDGRGAPTAGGGGSGGGGGKRTSTSGSGWVVALVLVLVVVVMGGGGWAWWRYRATDEQQDTVREVAGSVAAAVSSAWWLLVDKIQSIRSRGSGGAGGSGAPGEEMGYFQPLGDPGYDVEGRGNIFTLK